MKIHTRILYGFLYKGFQGILKILIFDFTLFKKTGLDLEKFRRSATIQFPRFLTSFYQPILMKIHIRILYGFLYGGLEPDFEIFNFSL